MIKIKRIYEEATASDGYRMLVDRLWPRGITKEAARLDEWNKEIAPSTSLRKWFGHKPELFAEFAKRYREELKINDEILNNLKRLGDKGNVTLLYAAKDEKINQAAVLLKVLTEK